MTAAPCAGQWWLFDSTDLGDHRVAKRLCDGCPIFNDCHDALLAAHQANPGGPRGTWAGRLVGEGGRAIDRPRDKERIAAEEAAYDEEACRIAKAAYARGYRDDWTRAGVRTYERRRRYRKPVA